MRALLVVNPMATATSSRVRDVLVRALGSELKVDCVETISRGHAVEVGRRAREEELDVVVVLGGDGTVNEVVNGLLAEPADRDVPALAVVPGGSTNVLARALGLPRDPVEATAEILAMLRGGRRRAIGLGRADGRWFTFCAGVGLDAEVVRAVEGHRGDGRRSTPGLFVRTALWHFYLTAERRSPALRLEVPGTEPVGGLHLAIVSNTSPWTYLGSIAVVPTPRASFDTGLDLLALRRLGTIGTLRVIRRMLVAAASPPRGRAVVARHDLATFRLVADRPLALQVDGEYVGARDSVDFLAVPKALHVVA